VSDVFTPLESAIILAVQCHARTTDKGGAPYILHPLRVMEAMGSDNPECQIVAVLHDVVEETRKHRRGVGGIMGIRPDFGDRIADAVDAITRSPDETYREYIKRCKANDLARWVKIQDLTDNLKKDRVPSYQHADYASLWRRYEEAIDMLICD
jgi:(p)ppGpp synthase/HD superfamily hydrolase